MFLLRILISLCCLCYDACGAVDIPRRKAGEATGCHATLPVFRAHQDQLESSVDEDQRKENASVPLTVFAINKPLVIPKDADSIQNVLLVNHSFANSYGAPFVGRYEPPTPSSFTHVHMNLTVTSQGRQFDRLATMYLGDIEVFRTSTAEPTPGGIVWTYSKDMTQYLSLWKADQDIIFDLGNLINDMYTGPFNVTVIATFFKLPHALDVPDVILPISAQQSQSRSPSAFILPSDNATSLHEIPHRFTRAIVSLAACGQGLEEFWYANVLSSLKATFSETGDLPGFSAFREVQLLIDGTLAGVSWPFPVIFTGGIAPGLWRPEVGLDAFDLRESEIDITVFLPYLQDGKKHSFEIRVVGLDDHDGKAKLSSTIGHYWVVTGKIFLFREPTVSSPAPGAQRPFVAPKRHELPHIDSPAPVISVLYTLSQTPNRSNETLSASVNVRRSLKISSNSSSWSQTLKFVSTNIFSHHGLHQITEQDTTAISQATYYEPNQSPQSWFISSVYPLYVSSNLTINPRDPDHDHGRDIEISADLSRALLIRTRGTRTDISTWTLNPFSTPDLPLSSDHGPATAVRQPFGLYTTQHGTAKYSSAGNKSYSSGETEQVWIEASRGDERNYVRNVWVRDGKVILDE